MSKKFPPTRKDGSFCIVIKFETIQNSANLRKQINEWCRKWVEENNAETRKHTIVDEEGNEVQPFDYYHAFKAPPYVIKSEGKQLWLRFDGVANSIWWRDWMARMMVGLTTAIGELHGQYNVSYNCDELD